MFKTILLLSFFSFHFSVFAQLDFKLLNKTNHLNLVNKNSADTLNDFPQTTHDSLETLSRLKLSVGYYGGKYIDIGENLPFLNLNYRATQLLKYDNTVQFSFAFEAGVNLVSGLFPLYAKTGPELEIINNLILASNIGYNGILIYPVPFYGVNGFYLIQLSKNINLEIEGGFHSSFWILTEPLYYLSLGISLD